MKLNKIDDALYVSPIEGFSELADTYDARISNSPVLDLEGIAVMAALPNDLGPGHRIADYGCGTGRSALLLAQRGPKVVVGIDLAPPMIAVAARKARRADLPIHWHVGDLLGSLPLPDASIDVGACTFALSFVPDVRPAFAEMARTLAPGGILLVSDYHPCGLFTARVTSRAKLANDHAPYFGFTSASGEECRIIQTPHTTADLFTAATRAGLTLEHISEPLVDHELASSYGSRWRDRIGTPLVLAMRFRKN